MYDRYVVLQKNIVYYTVYFLHRMVKLFIILVRMESKVHNPFARRRRALAHDRISVPPLETDPNHMHDEPFLFDSQCRPPIRSAHTDASSRPHICPSPRLVAQDPHVLVLSLASNAHQSLSSYKPLGSRHERRLRGRCNGCAGPATATATATPTATYHLPPPPPPPPPHPFILLRPPHNTLPSLACVEYPEMMDERNGMGNVVQHL